MVAQGPNVKKLIIHKMSLLMIPPGTENPLSAGVEAIKKFVTDTSVVKQATEWVESVILIVRQAAEPNPYKDASDDEIAREIIKRINANLIEKARAECSTPATDKVES